MVPSHRPDGEGFAVQVEQYTPLNRERLQLIERVGAALGEAGGLEDVPGAAIRPMVPELADLAVVVLDGPDGEERLAVAHVEAELAAGVSEAVRGAMRLLRRVAERELQNGRTFRWVASVGPGTLAFAGRGDSRVIKLVNTLRLQSLVVVALRTAGKAFGALALGRVSQHAPYGAADLAVAQVLARRIAVAVEAAQLGATLREAEKQNSGLEDALRRWTRVFDLAAWGAAVVDGRERRIEAVNPAFARMHGYPNPDDLTGRVFEELVDGDQDEAGPAWGLGPEGHGETYETVHHRADGSSFPALVSVTPMDPHGDQSAYVITVQELSELKRAEERLRRAQRMEAVGRLAGGVAHEVNNMMTIILGFSDLLGRSRDLPECLQRDVEEIRKAATRAGRVTQQLLAFSRQQVLQPTDLRINSIIEELVPVLRLLLPANVKVETRLSPLEISVRADRAQLEQVLINLAFNARDAMPAGGTIRVATDTRFLDEESGRRLIGIPFVPGSYSMFSIIDTGHGMDEATLSKVFEPFFTTKPVGMGTGLGLATVYGIVKQSGGYVWVQSTPGEGTTFTVGFPAVRPDEHSETPEIESEPAQLARGGKVLVVEDEDGVRELASRILGARGFEVLEARNGMEAISVLGRLNGKVDAVVTDVVVPDLGADELERRLRAIRPDVPLLFMSGYPREDVLQRKLIRPDHPFLQKPFTSEDLLAGVDRVLRKRDEVVGR
jgi:two-component system, cell cycle sensor histidine kinase and response regulator CckA